MALSFLAVPAGRRGAPARWLAAARPGRQARTEMGVRRRHRLARPVWRYPAEPSRAPPNRVEPGPGEPSRAAFRSWLAGWSRSAPRFAHGELRGQKRAQGRSRTAPIRAGPGPRGGRSRATPSAELVPSRAGPCFPLLLRIHTTLRAFCRAPGAAPRVRAPRSARHRPRDCCFSPVDFHKTTQVSGETPWLTLSRSSTLGGKVVKSH